MNRRLYFILPDVEISRKVEDDLLLARISEQQMHFLGKRGTNMQDLPEASQVQKTDIVHGFQVGMFTGALTGAIMGLTAYLMRDIIGMQMEVGIVLVLFLVGGVYGAFISGLFIGSSTPNVKLKKFQHSMDEGHILLMVDVAKDRVDEIRKIVHQHFPEVEDYGEDHTIPAFP
ncbi:MAG: DUF1269 domain-containing protein [Proteobacteria bacterium]|nr:DUF1269 domain-containing protein [Pseudomonadota bacterium]